MNLRQVPRIVEARARLLEARKDLKQALADATGAPVGDYVFNTLAGPVSLKGMFGDKRDLIVVHNMGSACNSCTMWADGLNGFYPHIADRASLFVVSPDPCAVQLEFANSRGWRFPMVSSGGSSFAADMGFANAAGKPLPGVSAFQMQDGQVVRASASPFDEYDEFCMVWRFFDLLAGGPGDWRPKRTYV